MPDHMPMVDADTLEVINPGLKRAIEDCLEAGDSKAKIMKGVEDYIDHRGGARGPILRAAVNAYMATKGNYRCHSLTLLSNTAPPSQSADQASAKNLGDSNPNSGNKSSDATPT